MSTIPPGLLPPYPEDWGAYPAAHYDEEDDCQCPDHRAQRQARLDDLMDHQ